MEPATRAMLVLAMSLTLVSMATCQPPSHAPTGSALPPPPSSTAPVTPTNAAPVSSPPQVPAAPPPSAGSPGPSATPSSSSPSPSAPTPASSPSPSSMLGAPSPLSPVPVTSIGEPPAENPVASSPSNPFVHGSCLALMVALFGGAAVLILG